MEKGANLERGVVREEQTLQESLKEVKIRKRMRIMVAIDESDVSFYALNWALDHLVDGVVPTNEPSQEESGLVTLVHVQQPFQYHVYPAGPGGAAFYASSSIIESVRKSQAENATALLSRALQMCKAKMIKAETLILEGDPKDKICQATEQMQVDILVVGSRGLGKIKRAFLGSVSDYCAHHAKCPILIVKPPKEVTKETSKNNG